GVERLLSGRGWLDTVAGGFGWNLLGRSRLALGRWAEGDIALSRYLEIATGAGDRDRGLAELRRGFALARDGKVSPALQTFDRAAELLPQLGDWIHVFAAQAAARAGDTATVRARLEATDPYLAREWAWRLLIDARAAAGDRDGAERAALAAVHELSSAGRRASAWVAVADLRLQRADTAGARTAYRRAMEASPGASAAVDAARKLSELPGLSATDRLRIGRLYLRHGNLTRGRAGLEAYLASGHGSEHEREQVRLELGRTYFREGRYAEAERLLLALADETSSARIGAEAMYQAGRAQYRQGRTDAGRATFLRTAERFPNERAAAQAVFLVADLDHDDGRLDAAREYYRRAARIQPGINEAGLALMRLGGIAFAEGDYNEAATIFEEYRRLHPDGRRYQQATYWAAKSYFELGKDDLARARLREARRSDPFSWYGLRAADLLGEDLWDVPLDASPPRNPAVEAEVAGAFARLDRSEERRVGKK